MAQSSVSTVNHVILEFLQGKGAMAPNDLVASVLNLNPDLSDVDVKRALWNMIACHELELSADQLILLPALPKRA